MPFYRVRDGVTVGHNDGVHIRTLEAGDVIDLPRALAELELAGKLEPCTPDGQSLAHLSADDYELALALPHEREQLKKTFAARDAHVPEPPPPATPAPSSQPFVQVVKNSPPAADAEGE